MEALSEHWPSKWPRSKLAEQPTSGRVLGGSSGPLVAGRQALDGCSAAGGHTTDWLDITLLEHCSDSSRAD